MATPESLQRGPLGFWRGWGGAGGWGSQKRGLSARLDPPDGGSRGGGGQGCGPRREMRGSEATRGRVGTGRWVSLLEILQILAAVLT